MSPLDSIVMTRIGSLGPHLVTTLAAVGGVAFILLKMRPKGIEYYPIFAGFAWQLHESVFQYLFFLSRAVQGLGGAQMAWSYFLGGATFFSAAFIGLGLYYFRDRLRLTVLWYPFIVLNVLWFSIGYPTSLSLGLGASDISSLPISAIEETYTLTFMLGLGGTFL